MYWRMLKLTEQQAGTNLFPDHEEQAKQRSAQFSKRHQGKLKHLRRWYDDLCKLEETLTRARKKRLLNGKRKKPWMRELECLYLGEDFYKACRARPALEKSVLTDRKVRPGRDKGRTEIKNKRSAESNANKQNVREAFLKLRDSGNSETLAITKLCDEKFPKLDGRLRPVTDAKGKVVRSESFSRRTIERYVRDLRKSTTDG